MLLQSIKVLLYSQRQYKFGVRKFLIHLHIKSQYCSAQPRKTFSIVKRQIQTSIASFLFHMNKFRRICSDSSLRSFEQKAQICLRFLFKIISLKSSCHILEGKKFKGILFFWTPGFGRSWHMHFLPQKHFPPACLA